MPSFVFVSSFDVVFKHVCIFTFLTGAKANANAETMTCRGSTNNKA